MTLSCGVARPIVYGLLLTGLLLAPGCGPKAPPTAAAMAGQALLDPVFLGVWSMEESAAIWTIAQGKTGVQVSGVDASDGEVFEISAVRVGEGELYFTSRMPSTDYTIHQRWVPLGEGRCTVTFTGDGSGQLQAHQRE